MGMGLNIQLIEGPAEYTTKTITCPSCEARLELTVSSLSEENKELTCSSCGATLVEKGVSVRLAIYGLADWLKKYAPWVGVAGLGTVAIYVALKKR